MKYIVFEDFSGDQIPIVFPARIMHDELREQLPYSTVLSAGYVDLGPNGFLCHGESKALKKQSRPEDAEVIARHFSPDAS